MTKGQTQKGWDGVCAVLTRVPTAAAIPKQHFFQTAETRRWGYGKQLSEEAGLW